jgi:hypothetical protein
MMIRLIVLLILFGILGSVHASYVFECNLTGVVVSEPVHRRMYPMYQLDDTEANKSQFQFKVVKTNGTDAFCEHSYVGKVMDVSVMGVPFDEIVLNKKIRLHYFYKDMEGWPKPSIQFTYLPEKP